MTREFHIKNRNKEDLFHFLSIKANYHLFLLLLTNHLNTKDFQILLLNLMHQ